MKAIWQGKVIAEAAGTKDVDGYCYFPRNTVAMDVLKLAPKTDSDKVCPHGVQFYDVTDGRKVSERAAWSYEKPSADPIRQVDHWVAFWGDDVQLRP